MQVKIGIQINLMQDTKKILLRWLFLEFKIIRIQNMLFPIQFKTGTITPILKLKLSNHQKVEQSHLSFFVSSKVENQ